MNPKIVAALELAIPAEIAAADLYVRLVDKATNEDTRKLFQSLTADERRHRQLLEARYQTEAGRAYAAGPVRQLRLPADASEMLWPAALTLAINGEADAHEAYVKSASSETDPGARAMYEILAEDEAGHRRLLEAEYAARLGQPFSDYELESWVRE